MTYSPEDADHTHAVCERRHTLSPYALRGRVSHTAKRRKQTYGKEDMRGEPLLYHTYCAPRNLKRKEIIVSMIHKMEILETYTYMDPCTMIAL